jgi:8-oxo-dGTP pyrophosphatase MutT (NUDIX family)
MREAVVIVIERAGRFVAIRRADGVARAGYWSPPTGRLESGEAQADAVRREAGEELGIVVEPVTKLWECDSDDGAWRLHWWRASTRDSVLVPAPLEVAEARWVDVTQFLALAPLFAQHREFFLCHYAMSPPAPE